MWNIEVIKIDDNRYPNLLKNIKNPPEKLYVNGDYNCFNLPCITIVGSRNMSEYGRKMTKKIVEELTNAGICIVSGLAVGIDSVAHNTCLENNGKTIAVLGSGLNKVFPPENMELYNKILKNNGCIISEYEPNEQAQKKYFPERNRIVSGLSLGTVIIEAAYRSGTSITAKFALSQGRKVFCIPNSIGNKNSYGTINLIKKGAIMITNGKEILYSLGIIKKIEDYDCFIEKQNKIKMDCFVNEQLKCLDEKTKKVYEYFRENKLVNSEILCKVLDMNIQDINVYLTILEIKGLIKNKYGNNYVIVE